ncbi:MAG TPA: hypothetical protein VG778_10895 [Blastocatellia bacterium]|nr:hypothetical protein [Blastocatellia bacterium]
MVSKPEEWIVWKLRKESNGPGYWLDFEAGPFTDPGGRTAIIELRTSTEPEPLKIQVILDVLAANLVVTPTSLNVAELPVSRLLDQPRTLGRLGVRKASGTFQITGLSSSLTFIRLQQQRIVEGSNYLITLSTDPASPPKAGSYEGVIRIETDDSRTPRIEVPIKLVLVDR